MVNHDQPVSKPPQASREPMSSRKAAAFLAITLALPFVLFAFLEIGLRVVSYGGDTTAFHTSEILPGYKVPGQLGRRYFPREQFPPAPSGDAFLVRKPSHSMRIFVLGESSAAGFPYPTNGTFSRVIRDALSDVLPSDTVEVINLGIAATNSYAIVDLAADVVREKPDAVIIYGGHNEYYGALGIGSTERFGSSPGLIRLYLKLQRLKTFLLFRNAVTGVLAAVRGGRSTRDVEQDASRMESIVADQRIIYGDATYKRGLAQYESNLGVALETFRRAGVPVFIGSTPSNLRDLTPFGPSAIPPDSVATRLFDSANVVLSQGDSVRAGSMFARARDADIVRFRAPGAFQQIVERVAKENGAFYVPVLEGVAAASAFHIPGNDLFLEHVHPNQKGYVLLARIYFEALARQGFVGRKADMSHFAGWDAYTARMLLTDLDLRIAAHTVNTVTTRWPFVPVSKQLDYRGTYRPVSYVDSVALQVSRGGMSWAEGKMLMGARYASAGDADRAVTEFNGLIRDAPGIEIAWRLAGQTLLAANQTARAKPYLERAYQIMPSAPVTYALGMISMQEKNRPRAIQLLEQTLQLTPNMPAALYHLSLAYALNRDLERARALAMQLARVSPGYPGLNGWMTTLGMSPR